MKIVLGEQPATVTRDLMRAVLAYVAHDNEPDAYHPEDLWTFRRAFAGVPEAVTLILEMLRPPSPRPTTGG